MPSAAADTASGHQQDVLFGFGTTRRAGEISLAPSADPLRSVDAEPAHLARRAAFAGLRLAAVGSANVEAQLAPFPAGGVEDLRNLQLRELSAGPNLRHQLLIRGQRSHVELDELVGGDRGPERHFALPYQRTNRMKCPQRLQSRRTDWPLWIRASTVSVDRHFGQRSPAWSRLAPPTARAAGIS